MWPAVLGHAGINSSQVLGGVVVLTSADANYDTAQVFLTGWTGWILPLLFIVLLVVFRRLPVPHAPDLVAAGEHEPARSRSQLLATPWRDAVNARVGAADPSHPARWRRRFRASCHRRAGTLLATLGLRRVLRSDFFPTRSYDPDNLFRFNRNTRRLTQGGNTISAVAGSDRLPDHTARYTQRVRLK